MRNPQFYVSGKWPIVKTIPEVFTDYLKRIYTVYQYASRSNFGLYAKTVKMDFGKSGNSCIGPDLRNKVVDVVINPDPS